MSALQQVIPGMEQYENAIREVKNTLNQSILRLGAILVNARSEFKDEADWWIWLSRNDLKHKEVSKAIELFILFGQENPRVDARVINAIASESQEVKQAVKAKLAESGVVKVEDYYAIKKEAKRIKSGDTVYFMESSGAINSGVADSVEDMVVVVKSSSGIMPMLVTELSKVKPSIKKEAQQTDLFPSDIKSWELEDLRATLYEVWRNPPSDLRAYLMDAFPEIESWGNK